MSAASEFGATVIERRFGPVIPDGLDYEARATVAGDQIAYWLHWVDVEHDDPEDGLEAVCTAIANAERHFNAERREGDDISRDSHYYEMIAALP